MTRHGSRKKPSAIPSEEEALLSRLEAALSDGELRRVHARALLELDDGARARVVASLGPETAAALGSAFESPRKSRRKAPSIAPASKGKTAQEWDRLWSEWNALVGEACDEGGKYVVQDAHWEPPYLDTGSLSTDLDAVVARMGPLVVRVIADRIASDLSMAAAIRALDEDLDAALRSGIAEAGEPLYLGPKATAMLLEWEWAAARCEARRAQTFFDFIRDLELRLKHVHLDESAVQKFVLRLPEEPLRALLESMTRQRSAKRWSDAFGRAHGSWAEILRVLSKRWSPELHVQVSRANIGEDWTLALPLLKDAVRRRAFDETQGLIGEAVQALLRNDESKPWDPRSELLIRRRHFFGGEDEKRMLVALLNLWRRTAEGQGQADFQSALAVQIAAIRDAEGGDRMLDAFAAVPPALQELHDALFADWRALIVDRTLPSWRYQPKPPSGEWVSALVDAARSGPSGAASFHAAVRSTLSEARAASAVKPRPVGRSPWSALDRDRSPLPALAVMTRDLGSTAPMLKKSAPKLLKLLSACVGGEGGRLQATRRAWCARLGARSLLPEVLAFWRDVGARFVPDPANATGDYTASAEWLAAIDEVNPQAARELLAQWVEIHRRRRNLWRDLARRGFSVGSR
jgi:hypothetical protein